MSDVADTIVEALRDVRDPCGPELGSSVVDLGLLRAVAVDHDRARVELVLTTHWCPFVVDLLTAITDRVQALPDVADARVEIVWHEDRAHAVAALEHEGDSNHVL